MIMVTLCCLALGYQPPRVQAQAGTSAGLPPRRSSREALT
jgi:hypothetical protein